MRERVRERQTDRQRVKKLDRQAQIERVRLRGEEKESHKR